MSKEVEIRLWVKCGGFTGSLAKRPQPPRPQALTHCTRLHHPFVHLMFHIDKTVSGTLLSDLAAMEQSGPRGLPREG
jgi:hypothetical protein